MAHYEGWHTYQNAPQIPDASSAGFSYTTGTSALPSQIHSVTGLHEAAISVYPRQDVTVTPDYVTVVAEIIAARNDKGQGKTYPFLVGKTPSDYVFKALPKIGEGHHYPLTERVPFWKSFERLSKRRRAGGTNHS